VLGEGPAPEVMNRETKHDHLEGFSLLSAGFTPGVEHVAAKVDVGSSPRAVTVEGFFSVP
jgi:hypothetical protein